MIGKPLTEREEQLVRECLEAERAHDTQYARLTRELATAHQTVGRHARTIGSLEGKLAAIEAERDCMRAERTALFQELRIAQDVEEGRDPLDAASDLTQTLNEHGDTLARLYDTEVKLTEATSRGDRLHAQLGELATFIMSEVPGALSLGEGAVPCAISWMRKQLAALSNQLAALTDESARRREAELERDRLRAEVDEETGDLESANIEWQRRYDELSQHAGKLREELDRLSETVVDQLKTIAALKAGRDRLMARVGEYERQDRDAALQSVQDVMAERDRLRAELDAYRATLRTTDTQATSLAAWITALQSELERVRADLEETRARCNHVESEATRISIVRDELSTQLTALQYERDRLRAQKDVAYEERNRLVAVFARMALALGWRAGIGEHEDKPGEDWESDWRTLVVVETPHGQASWHFHDSHRRLLEDLPRIDAKWDGHDTPEKYRRMDALVSDTALQSRGAAEVPLVEVDEHPSGDSLWLRRGKTQWRIGSFPSGDAEFFATVTRNALAALWPRPESPDASEVERLREELAVALNTIEFANEACLEGVDTIARAHAWAARWKRAAKAIRKERDDWEDAFDDVQLGKVRLAERAVVEAADAWRESGDCAGLEDALRALRAAREKISEDATSLSATSNAADGAPSREVPSRPAEAPKEPGPPQGEYVPRFKVGDMVRWKLPTDAPDARGVVERWPDNSPTPFVRWNDGMGRYCTADRLTPAEKISEAEQADAASSGAEMANPDDRRELPGSRSPAPAGSPEAGTSIEGITKHTGAVWAFNIETCWGEVHLDSGNNIEFHSTSFQSTSPTRFPVIGERVEVTLQHGRMVDVRSAPREEYVPRVGDRVRASRGGEGVVRNVEPGYVRFQIDDNRFCIAYTTTNTFELLAPAEKVEEAPHPVDVKLAAMQASQESIRADLDRLETKYRLHEYPVQPAPTEQAEFVRVFRGELSDTVEVVMGDVMVASYDRDDPDYDDREPGRHADVIREKIARHVASEVRKARAEWEAGK